MIRAHVSVFNDEGYADTDFDATPWFDQASSKMLANLDATGYEHSHAADWVFKWMALHTDNPALQADYRLVERDKWQVDVVIDAGDVRRWRNEQQSKHAANRAVDALLGEEMQPAERDEPFQWSREGLMRLLSAVYKEDYKPAYLNEPGLMSVLGRLKWIEQAALYHYFEQQMACPAVGRALAVSVPAHMTQSTLPTQTQRTWQILQRSLRNLRDKYDQMLNIRVASYPPSKPRGWHRSQY